jgi:hypothetical protein
MKEVEGAAEPSSSLQPPIFMIGRDGEGNWVVQEQSRTRGGLFVDRAAALKFAKSENGNHAVVWISGILELDLTRNPSRNTHFKTQTIADFSRYAAVSASRHIRTSPR